jgi:competence protein ComEA
MNASLKSCLASLFLAPLLAVSVPAPAGPVNINTADAETLAHELSGIGPSKAASIVDYRTKHGAFKSADDLALVKGIGTKFIERNRADLRVSNAAGAPIVPSKQPTSLKLPPNAKPAKGADTKVDDKSAAKPGAKPAVRSAARGSAQK